MACTVGPVLIKLQQRLALMSSKTNSDGAQLTVCGTKKKCDPTLVSTMLVLGRHASLVKVQEGSPFMLLCGHVSLHLQVALNVLSFPMKGWQEFSPGSRLTQKVLHLVGIHVLTKRLRTFCGENRLFVVIFQL